MLRFLSKCAFLANIVFAIVFAMHWIKGVAAWDPATVSQLVVTGYFVAIPLNLLVNIWILIAMAGKRKVAVERWLQVANALFLILQMIYFQFT